MSTPAGWYPQPDGQQRYWDGQQWTENFAPGVPPVAPISGGTQAPPTFRKSDATASPERRFGVDGWLGWGSLALVVMIGALSSGFSGAVVMFGLFAFVIAVIALVRGRVGWARLRSRAAGGAALGVALAAMIVGGIAAAPSTPSGGQAPASDTAGGAVPSTGTPNATAKAVPTPTVTVMAAPKTTPAPTSAAPVSQLGKTVRDGRFAFTITAVKCGITQVGSNPYLTKKAQGQFCRASLTVKNIGDQAQMMSASNQYLFDTQGRRFSADSEASIYDDSSKLIFEEINPGNSIKGSLYFDVPNGARVSKFELHDSMFSEGVEVQL